jgi:hypothetical protein
VKPAAARRSTSITVMNNELDPGTICARTNAGELELRAARSGLTLPQRRALSLISAPQVFAELAAEHRLDPTRLGRGLVRLSELGLIVLHVPPARMARSEAVGGDVFPSHSSLATAAPRRPAALLVGLALALAAAIAVWLGLRH